MNAIPFILLPLLSSIVLSALIIPRILVVAYRKKLFDHPNERKVHTAAIPRLGGVHEFSLWIIISLILVVLFIINDINLIDRLSEFAIF